MGQKKKTRKTEKEDKSFSFFKRVLINKTTSTSAPTTIHLHRFVLILQTQKGVLVLHHPLGEKYGL